MNQQEDQVPQDLSYFKTIKKLNLVGSQIIEFKGETIEGYKCLGEFSDSSSYKELGINLLLKIRKDLDKKVKLLI